MGIVNRKLMRIVLALLVIFGVSSASAQTTGQDVILAVGLNDGAEIADLTGNRALNELAQLNPEAKLLIAPSLEAAKSLVAEGDRIVILVMVGDSVQRAVDSSTISGSPGRKAGFTIAHSIPAKSLSPSLLLYFWNCIGKCRVQSTSRFQKDFRESFLERIHLEQPEQKLVIANHIAEGNGPGGRRILRLLISGVVSLANALPNPFRVLHGLRSAVLTTTTYLLPPNMILISLSYLPSKGAYAGVALGLLWTAKVYLPDSVSDRIFGSAWRVFRKTFSSRPANQCALLVGP